MPAYTEDDILGALDDAQASERFPELDDSRYIPLSARILAYRDDARWAIIFCLIRWDSSDGITVRVEPIGNCVTVPRPDNYDELLAEFAEEWDDLEDIHKEDFEIEDGVITKLPRRPLDVELEEEFAPSAEYYAKQLNTVEFEMDYGNGDLEKWGYVSRVCIRGREVDLDRLKLEPDFALEKDGGFWVAVALLERYREELLPRDQELAKYFSDGAPPKFIVLDEWHYSRYNLPSQWEVFGMLAKVMVEGDVSLYQPTEEPNTHWESWVAT